MTKQELNDHLALRQKLARSLELLAALEATGDLAAEIVDVNDSIACIEAEVRRSEAAVAAYISTIKDDRTRMIFRLRFIRGLEWRTVARVLGGSNTMASVTAICTRYLEAHHEQ